MVQKLGRNFEEWNLQTISVVLRVSGRYFNGLVDDHWFNPTLLIHLLRCARKILPKPPEHSKDHVNLNTRGSRKPTPKKIT